MRPKLAQEMDLPLSSWASARGGKWHRTTEDRPGWTRETRSVCGLAFIPLNVTWKEDGERSVPPTNETHICKHCVPERGA